ncbi:hypothetical protein DL764_007639 [Monosporascus ibericus]|uniref:Tubby C-terminal domain-containing protein n=1 Tax=Monosporascus ibericus TaxID=155417 RepID=A0A4Q4T2Y7_9PEZI|nr:hypothetical protein DL764_007639 [Monosporascus ibericus]
MADMRTSQTDNSTFEPREDAWEVAQPGFRKYHMRYTTSRMNVRMHLNSPSAPATYYLETQVSLKLPQLLLRRGGEKTGPIVSFGKLKNTSRHALLGKGDCQKQLEEQLGWEELQREKNMLRRSDYQFGTSEGSRAGRRAEFFWRKDREKVLKTVYDCVDEDGRVVARMLSGGAFNWKRAGEIDIRDGLDQGLEEFLLISALTIWFIEAFAYQSFFQGF